MFILGQKWIRTGGARYESAVYYGKFGAGKSRYAYEKILAEAARHPEKNYLIVVPEQFTMQTQKELVSLHPAGGILNIYIFSFQRLAYRIFEAVSYTHLDVYKRQHHGSWSRPKSVTQPFRRELTKAGLITGVKS